MEVPSWLPVRPRLNRLWLRGVVNQALDTCFNPPPRRGNLRGVGVVKA